MMVMIMMTVTMMTPENADRVVPETLVLFFGEKKTRIQPSRALKWTGLCSIFYVMVFLAISVASVS